MKAQEYVLWNAVSIQLPHLRYVMLLNDISVQISSLYSVA